MQSRREFLRYASMLGAGAAGMGVAGGGGGGGAWVEAVRRAVAILPDPGTTFEDAEHIVILMQENRSFDHCYGTLRGVRGYGDPRAVTLPDGNPVWAQAEKSGVRYGPFRLDLTGSRITWMGSLPHSWTDQVDAAAGGRHDGWLEAKRSGAREYAAMPLTMGTYTREDIPFYYALADAFTVCDQNFCSSLTGTTPNRLYLWTGTCRDPRGPAHARVLNSDTDYGVEAAWATFPERLEDLGIPWRVYQNEISLGTGLEGEADAWLTNFTDNPLEWFRQYGVRFSAARRAYVAERVQRIPGEIAEVEAKLKGAEGEARAKLEKRRKGLEGELAGMRAEAGSYTQAAWEALPERARALHDRAFTTNAGDAAYRTLATHAYEAGGQKRSVAVPAGDTLARFRADVEGGKLPAVSWVVAPERFSDHPGSAWYGAWYVSEVLGILTKNPAVWRRTIFILTYDENDGYFDHVPPFQAPDPSDPATGRVSPGADCALEYVTMSEERARKSAGDCRKNSIGLGFRVPMVVCSPWSRGGAVCSQVFDHTSVIQLVEKVFARRTGGKLRETNITPWRRAVCGDMTALFRPAAAADAGAPDAGARDAYIEKIHEARFQGLPAGFRAWTAGDLADLRAGRRPAGMPVVEPGVRPSCPLPYELEVNGRVPEDRSGLEVEFTAGRGVFGVRAAGAPFQARASGVEGGVAVRHYAAAAGASVKDMWRFDEFEGGLCRLSVAGPNGFLREFVGRTESAAVEVRVRSIPEAAGGPAVVSVDLVNRSSSAVSVGVVDHAYGTGTRTSTVPAGGTSRVRVDATATGGWYDFTVSVTGGWSVRAAGRVETGAWSTSDPAMGRA